MARQSRLRRHPPGIGRRPWDASRGLLFGTIVTVWILNCVGLAVGCHREADEWANLKATIREKFPAVQYLTTEELRAWRKETDREQPVLLDARAPGEYEVSHLRGAHLASTTAEAMAVLAQIPKDRPVVVYCSVGYRSARMAERIQRVGYKQVYNLEGSIFEWANEDGPLYRGETRVKTVHPYDEKWGRFLERRLWSTTGDAPKR